MTRIVREGFDGGCSPNLGSAMKGRCPQCGGKGVSISTYYYRFIWDSHLWACKRCEICWEARAETDTIKIYGKFLSRIFIDVDRRMVKERRELKKILAPLKKKFDVYKKREEEFTKEISDAENANEEG